MQFSISDEQEMTRSVLREFAESEVAPKAVERDEKEQFNRSLFDKMGQLGLTGIPIDELNGGAGSEWMTFIIVIEELARVCASTAAKLASHTVYAAWPIYTFGGEALKAMYLKDLVKGVKLGGCALPSFDEESGGLTCSISARHKGDYWELSGEHPYVIHADSADYCFVIARTELNRKKPQFNTFLIERGTIGWQIGKRARTMGLRSFHISNLKLDKCQISQKNKIGNDGQGHEIALSLIDIAHLSAAAQSVGIAQGAYEAAASYAKERKQFGTLIGKQQGISFKLADMSAQLEAARLLTYQAAWRKDEGLNFTKEAAIARKFSAEMAVAVAIEAVQIFGGYGYMQEYRVERFLRDAKCLETKLGTGGIEADCIYRVLKD
ncbi:acyl-CoA dehydrogenase family protein [Bacillus sp. FJAT-28004]|uniref:acyl-CoA dehydrogenase family protein n=1 Tax=Bacillus sp. FJAT-28004 TaxID=1679165 RepID=UPI0006B5522D|nr:acyl-CoA dehydrogenase family protein [Bacillus sp. FJAT-28004]